MLHELETSLGAEHVSYQVRLPEATESCIALRGGETAVYQSPDRGSGSSRVILVTGQDATICLTEIGVLHQRMLPWCPGC